jgi:hypothetical protein
MTLYHGAHGTINDQNPLLQGFLNVFHNGSVEQLALQEGSCSKGH